MYGGSPWPSVEQPYWERSGGDYIARRARMPVVESAVYDYPNAEGIMINYNLPSGNHHCYSASEGQKKIHFAELDKTTEVGWIGKHEVTEEKVDNEADRFIRRRHKIFEMMDADKIC